MNDDNEWLWAEEEIVFEFSRQLPDAGWAAGQAFLKQN
jgi:hypothetical protein